MEARCRCGIPGTSKCPADETPQGYCAFSLSTQFLVKLQQPSFYRRDKHGSVCRQIHRASLLVVRKGKLFSPFSTSSCNYQGHANTGKNRRRHTQPTACAKFHAVIWRSPLGRCAPGRRCGVIDIPAGRRCQQRVMDGIVNIRRAAKSPLLAFRIEAYRTAFAY